MSLKKIVFLVSMFVHVLLAWATTPYCFAATNPKATTATELEVAEFWGRVFKGPKPYGVPPLNAERKNPRTVGAVTLWDVHFDSYRDPDTNRPVRLAGVLGVPNEAGRKFPGLVVTHSVGAPNPAPDNIEEMAIFFAGRKYVALAFFMRGWGGSRMAKVNVDSPQGRMDGFYCANLVDDGKEPFDNVWAGFPVDMYQAGEFLAAQSEVSDPNALAVIGHSGGGYAALMAGVFNKRYTVLVASAPAATSPDPDRWMSYWKNSPWRRWADSQPDPVLAMARATRAWSYTGAYPALNNAHLVAKDRNWKLKDTAVWLYAGENDPAVPSSDVEAAWRRLDSSNEKVLHVSPSGAHGGPESWLPAQAWLAGHYPGRNHRSPKADLRLVSQRGGAVILSGEASSDSTDLVGWEYDLGDGTVRHWGSSVGHTYIQPGSYTARLTVTNGAGLRDTAAVQLLVPTGLPTTAPPEKALAPGTAVIQSATSSLQSLRVSVGDTVGRPGDAVSLPIMISGTEGSTLTSLSLTVEFDHNAFLQPRVARGPAIPGPAWWNFTTRTASPGVQVVSAEQFVISPAPALNGVVAHLVLNVAETTNPGSYAVKVTRAEANDIVFSTATYPASVSIEANSR